MRLFYQVINKKKTLLALFFMILYAFNGVMLSYIIVYAGKVVRSTSGVNVALFGVASLISWLIVYSANYFLNITIASLIKEINIELKQRYFLNEFSKQGFKKESSGVVSKLANDFKLIENDYFQVIFSMLEDVLIFIVSITYMLYLNTVVSLAFIIFSFLPIIIPKLFSKKLEGVANDWSVANGNYLKVLKESLQGMSVIKAYSAYEPTFLRVNNALNKVEERNYSMIKIQSFAQFLAEVLSGISFILPFIIGCYLIIYAHTLSISILIGIFLANDRVVGPLVSITDSLNKIFTTQNLLTNMFPKKQATSTVSKISDVNIDTAGQTVNDLRLDHVTYQMTSSKKLTANVQLKGNFKVLIYGDSGSGKTTLLNLIRAAIIPNSGMVLAFDDKRNLVDLKSNIAYIEQTPYIFDTSIENNLTLFQNDKYSKESLYSVLKEVSLFDELGGKKSLRYVCGDDGDRLSGGQRQRIEIARALLRNKGLYLVDEATANLDKSNSKQIRDILFGLDKPVIEVAHHFDKKESRYTQKFVVKNGTLILVSNNI